MFWGVMALFKQLNKSRDHGHFFSTGCAMLVNVLGIQLVLTIFTSIFKFKVL